MPLWSVFVYSCAKSMSRCKALCNIASSSSAGRSSISGSVSAGPLPFSRPVCSMMASMPAWALGASASGVCGPHSAPVMAMYRSLMYSSTSRLSVLSPGQIGRLLPHPAGNVPCTNPCRPVPLWESSQYPGIVLYQVANGSSRLPAASRQWSKSTATSPSSGVIS